MKKQIEDLVIQRCVDFKKIIKKSKLLLIGIICIDIYLLSEFFIILTTCQYKLPLIVAGILLVKIIFNIIKRDVLIFDIIGIVFYVMLFILADYFKLLDYNTIIAIVFALFLHLLHIKSCYIINKINNIYGFPAFNSFFIINEMEKNELLLETVENQYRCINYENKIIEYELNNIHSKNTIKIMKIIGMISIITGICLSCCGINTKSRLNNAVDVSYLKNYQEGTYIKGTIDKIYTLSSASMDKNAVDCYWCDFKGDCVTIIVPNDYKQSFAKLYNYYASLNNLLPYDGYSEITEQSSKAIEFIGEIHYINKYDSNSVINEKVLENIECKNINNTVFIELIDVNSSINQIFIGLLLLFLGTLLIISIILINKYKTFHVFY